MATIATETRDFLRVEAVDRTRSSFAAAYGLGARGRIAESNYPSQIGNSPGTVAAFSG